MSDQSEADATETDGLLLECRVCLEEKSVRFMSWDIFTPLTEKGFSAGTTIALELSRLAKVEVRDVNGYPKYICKSCLENLVSAIELVRDVKKSEETLANKNQTGKLEGVQTWPKPIELDKNLNEEVLRNSMDIDVKQEIPSDDDCVDTGMDDDKQDSLSLTDIKIEPDDITEHPAIQVTVNDSRATNTVINLEESENDPLMQYIKNIPTPSSQIGLTIGDNQSNSTIHSIQNTTLKSVLKKAIQDMDDQLRNGNQLINIHNINDAVSGSTLKNKNNNVHPIYKKRKTTKKFKALGPPCNCKLNCLSKISIEQREIICNYYNSQDTSKQRAFIISFTCKAKPCSRNLTSKRKRMLTFKYYLPLSTTFSNDIKTAERIRVCKTMFMNTVAMTSKTNTERVWKSYETFKMVDGRGRHRRNVDSDAVKSVCTHFKEMQNNKLIQLKALSSGLRREPIKKLPFNQMFKLYRLWVLSKDYERTVLSQDTYKRIILKHIPQDQIHTLQKGIPITVSTPEKKRSNQSYKKETYDNDEVELISVNNSAEMCLESLDIDLLAISALNDAENNVIDIDPFEERKSENDDDDNDPNVNFSDSMSEISNFSDDLKEETNQEHNSEIEKKKTERKIKNKTSKDNGEISISENFDENDDTGTIENKVAGSKMCTRKKSDLTDISTLDLPKEIECNINNAYIHNTKNKTEQDTASLTATRKKPTRNPAVIGQYCKYHGLANETDSSRVIPKKVVGPPCTCIKRRADNISCKKRKTKQAKTLGPPCNCKMNCLSKISIEQRQNICNYYHSQDTSKQRAFIISFTCKAKPCSRNLTSKRKRMLTFKYYLPLSKTFSDDIKTAEKIRVCKIMFMNTVAMTSKTNTERVWKSYETFKMVDGRGRYRRNTDSDAVKSVCTHFKELQNNKLIQFKALSSDLKREPIKKLPFNQMFKLYRHWVLSKDYERTVLSQDTYKRIILKHIPQDQIHTLQKGIPITVSTFERKRSNKSYKKEMYDNDEVELMSVNNSGEICSESLDVDLLAISALNEAENNVIDIDPFEERKSDNDNDDNDPNVNFSDSMSEISNFSDDLKEETNQEHNSEIEKKKTERKIKNKTSKDIGEISNSENVDEDDDTGTIENKVAGSKMCTRKKSDLTEISTLDLPKEIECNINNAYIHNTKNKTEQDTASLTATRKKPTRNPAVIGQYCKYHGLANETDSGRVIPKKVVGPPCTCIKRRADNISCKKRKTKQAKTLGPPCNCKMNCLSKISIEQRQNICNYYHSQDTSKQRAFIISFTCKAKPCSRNLTSKRKRMLTFKYYLPLSKTFSDDIKTAEKIRVCKIMFMNTVAMTSKTNTERVWKSYETFKMVDGRGRYRRNTDSDAVKSVCTHFKELQNNKLIQFKALSSGLKREPIKKLPFNQMFKLYRLWVLSKDYERTVLSQDTYKRIILKHIPQDQIHTLQKGIPITLSTPERKRSNKSYKKETYDNDEVELISVNNSGEMCSESLDVDLLAISALNEAENNVIDIDPFEERKSENDDDDNDPNVNFSDSTSEVSNFSEDFKEEINQDYYSEIAKKGTKMKLKRKIKKKTSQHDGEKSTSESSEDDYDIENIKKEVVARKMCTRNKSDKTPELDVPEEIGFNINYSCAEIKTEREEALLTAKRKKPTRDPAVVRQYRKYHGLAYETDSGRIIPKKVLGPPCSCLKHCADNITQDQRQFIFNHFWGLGNKKEQILFIRKFTLRVKTQRMSVNALKNRGYGLNYFLPTTTNPDNDAEKVRVCYRMFYNTLQCSNALTKRAWNRYEKKLGLHKDITNMTEEQNGEISNKDTSQSEQPQKSGSKRKRVDPAEDNTIIDFVYRAMPFDEFMNYFGKERNKDNPCNTDGENKITKLKKTSIKRNHFKRYVNAAGKINAENIMGPLCNCKMGCYNKITDTQRIFLFEYFWALESFCKQRAFIVRFSGQKDPKSHINGRPTLRDKYEYYLPTTKDFDGDKVKVCQTMLRNTLAVTQQCILTSWRKYRRGQFSDDRGKFPRKSPAVSGEFVSAKDHIDHLRRHDPGLETFKIYTKQYPEGVLSPAKLFKHYNDHFDSTTHSTKIKSFKAYYNIYRKMKKLLQLSSM